MSRWLKSVNSLLEQLDGQAETVAVRELTIENTLGHLLEGARTDGVGATSSEEEDDDDSSLSSQYEYEEELYSTEDGGEIEEELIVEPETGIKQAEDGDERVEEDFVSSDGEGIINPLLAAPDEVEKNEEALSIEMQRRSKGQSGENDDTVSDISTSEYTEEVIEEDQEGSIDVPPKTPNRHHSSENQVLEVMISSEHSKKSTNLDGNKESTHSKSQDKATTKVLDASPRPPRRSMEEVEIKQGGMIESIEVLSSHDGDAGGGGTARSKSSGGGHSERQALTSSRHSGDSAAAKTGDDSAPPKLPTRQSSFPLKVKTSEETKLKAAMEIHAKQQVDAAESTTIAEAAQPAKKKDYNDVQQKLLQKVKALEAQLKKATSDLRSSQAEEKKLSKQLTTLFAKMETAEAEINAQREELLRAGERMEKDRTRWQEEREDLLDDHDDELEQIREAHERELNELRSQYEKQMFELENRLQLEERKRMQEGGDWTKELEDALQRERDALKRLHEVDSQKSALQSRVSKLEMQQTALQHKVESVTQTAKTASEREREAEDKLDAAMSLHARQIAQRQEREAELERTIFDLGTALTISRQKEGASLQPIKARAHDAEDTFREKYENTVEELETLKVQLRMETQRREALQEELNDISKERTEEASSILARQMQHDRKVADLELTVSRLQSQIREQKNGNSAVKPQQIDGRGSQLQSELDESRLEIARLSENLLRLQERIEGSKAEILALKGRLQSAIARAETAEKSLATVQSPTPTTTARLYELEGGTIGISNPGLRRRVKGGTGRRGTAVRSIRSALNMGSGSGQVAVTIDAIDSWMVETGSFLRHEPLARLGFLLYLMTLHLWSFALVVFHTSEVPHADFGSMDNNPRHWRSHA